MASTDLSLNDALRNLIEAKRDELGWSREQLASLAGVSGSTIASLELGRRRPTEKVLAMLAAPLGAKDLDHLRRLAELWLERNADEDPEAQKEILDELEPRHSLGSRASRISEGLSPPLVADELAELTESLRRLAPAEAARLAAWLREVVAMVASHGGAPPLEALRWSVQVAAGEGLRDLDDAQRDRLREALLRHVQGQTSDASQVATLPAGQVHYVFTNAVAEDDDGRLWLWPLARAFAAGDSRQDPLVTRWDTGQVVLDTSQLDEQPPWQPRDPARHVLRATAPHETSTEVADLHDAYAATVIDVEFESGPVSVSPLDPSSGERVPGGVDHIHVITAYNPRSRLLPAAANEERNRMLRGDIERVGWTFVPASGRSVDSSWSEPSFAILDASPEEIEALAERWEQNAVYQWNADGVSIRWVRRR